MLSKHLFLTGFMGAGKTLVGETLATLLKCEVIDTDKYIEKRTMKTVAEIFRTQGESSFRDLETEALNMLLKEKPMIITTGGGIVIRAENRKLMRENGIVIFLYCDLAETMRRLENDKTRPLFKANYVDNERLFKQRLPLYEEANFIINTTNRSISEIATEILQYLE